jgi:two-component system, OmpR family, response regulator MtrA
VAEPRALRLLWLAPQAPPQETARAMGQAGWQVLHLDGSDRTADWVGRLAPDMVVLQMHIQAVPWLLEIRRTTTAPILVLTLARQDSAQSCLFESGADAVLHSGSTPRLLLARLAALQRLRPAAGGGSVHVGELLVPPLLRGARWGPQVLDLSPTEQALLHELVRSQGRAVTRSALGACLAPGRRERASRTVDVMISRLRLRLKKQAVHEVQIRAVPGVGYCLTRRAAAPTAGSVAACGRAPGP